MCPPGPDTRTWIRSQAAVIAPERTPSWPASRRGSQCSAKIRPTDAIPPAASTSSAPPRRLLGGLEDQPDPAGQLARGGLLGQEQAGPSSTVVCTSWPQAWQTSGTVER